MASGRTSDRQADSAIDSPDPLLAGSESSAWARALSVLGVLMGVGFLTAVPIPLTAANIGYALIPGIIAFVLVGVAFVSGLMDGRIGRGGALVLSLATLFSGGFHAGDRLLPMFLNRSFNLYDDAPLLRDLLHLISVTRSPLAYWFWFALGVIGIILILWLLQRAYQTVARNADRSSGLWFVGLAAVLFGLKATLLPEVLSTKLPARIAEEFRFIRDIPKMQADLEARIAERKSSASSMNGEGWRDVHIFIVESYGSVSLDLPEVASPEIQEFERAAVESGFTMVTREVVSPVFGGSSWLAFATINAGIRIEDNLRYDWLLDGDALTLPQVFKKQGYRSEVFMPGTRRAWPEGEFYGFDRIWAAQDFGYAGPAFGWSTMPDQFMLDRAKEMWPVEGPRFIQYTLSSSHAPFSEVPTYVEDWESIGDGSLFETHPRLSFDADFGSAGAGRRGYAASIDYDFRVLRDFVLTSVPDSSLIIIMGDHQPNRKITGPDQPWTVPMHVLSRDSAVVDVFTGFAGPVPMESLFDIVSGVAG